MRIFQSFGMAERLATDMLQDMPVQMVMPDGSVFLQIKNPQRIHGWPVSNFFYQPFLETALADGLAKYTNVSVMRGRELVRFEQDADGVEVFHVASEGAGYGKPPPQLGAKTEPLAEESRVRARYLIGADGGRSLVRTQLGIAMAGKSFPNPWLVVDIKAKDPHDGLRHIPYFSFICDPLCPTVNCVQPSGHHRFEFMLMPGQTKEQMEAPDTVRRYLSKYVDVDKFDVLRSLVYTFNALIAERWREGRVLLAGDAAHMTPQFIGQGMNAGVRDGYNLSWKLDLVLRGQAGDALLDTYETERRPHAAAMIREGVRMKDFVSMVNPIGTTLRNLLARTAVRLPVLGPFVTKGGFIPKPVYRSGAYFGMRRPRWRAAEGKLMPQPSLRGHDGRRQQLDDLVGNDFVLIGAGVDPRPLLDADATSLWESIGGKFAVVYPFGGRPQGEAARGTPQDLIEAEDPDGTYYEWLRASGVSKGCVAIVRPDKFIFALVRANTLSEAMHELARQLHRAGRDALAARGGYPPSSAGGSGLAGGRMSETLF